MPFSTPGINSFGIAPPLILLSTSRPLPGSWGSTKSLTCLITTNGNCYIEINDSATTDSFPLTSSDTMVIRMNHGNTLGARGNGGTRTITVKKYVS